MVTALQPWDGYAKMLQAPVCCRANMSRTFLTQDRRNSGFLKQVCHSHPNNLQHSSKQIGMHFHGIIRVSLGADMDWSTVTHLFPVSKEKWLLLALQWCLHSCMEESKKVAGAIAFLLSFQEEQAPTLCAQECLKASNKTNQAGRKQSVKQWGGMEPSFSVSAITWSSMGQCSRFTS